MSLETGVEYIDDLVITNPANSNDPSEGDDHLRLIKKALKQSFPAITGAVTSTQDELNILDGATATFTEINYLDLTTGPGTQEASKAVVADANVNTGISKITELHIGASGSEVQVTATAAELNILDGVTGFIDDDSMATATSTNISSGESIKAYVDNSKEDYILIEDRKTSGTDGGTATSGSWETRDLNTESEDAGTHASISSNQITLAAGTYRVRITAPAYFCGDHRARLYNVTDAAVQAGVGGNDLYGTTERSSSAGGYAATRSVIVGRFTIASSKVLRVEHIVEVTRATQGYGNAGGFGEEIYTQVELWKEN